MKDQQSPSARGTTAREPRVVVRCFPRSDGDFETYVRGILEHTLQTAEDARTLLAAVIGELQARYPAATIQPRDELAEFGADDWSTWYVYRDGRAA
jgi:hypothetical protein